MKKLILAIKSFRILGWKASFQFALYQTLLITGWFQIVLPKRSSQHDPKHLTLSIPSFKEVSNKIRDITKNSLNELILEADEICSGKVRLFGGEPVSLNLSPVRNPQHWSKYHSSQLDGKDIKTIWEPGRFGWGITLARAYSLTGEENYASKFWKYLEEFQRSNPANTGSHWSSAQEVALRLISLVFSYSLLETTATPTQQHMLTEMLIEHAERIPPTLIYSQAQGNNHLLTEAAALYTAGVILPDHPKSSKWKSLGWKHFNAGIHGQIESDGTYMQHSTNYHRLMLHTALWMHSLSNWHGQKLPKSTQEKLSKAYRWLLAVTNPENGQAPNLGANDGAKILPLSISDFSDFRPVLQASGIAFANERPFKTGLWDELNTWLLPANETNFALLKNKPSWATLRCAKHGGRPSHSDQLHVDLWWRGLNITQDAGTFSYNSAPPWNNTLKGSDVHNTVTINGLDQMQSAGRFRWVAVAQGRVIENKNGVVKATHDGYHKLGVEHIRELHKVSEDEWKIADTIQTLRPKFNGLITARCHWLLPSWDMEIKEGDIRLKSPHGWILISFNSEQEYELNIVKAGKQLVGSGYCPPYRGWVSKTYLHKEPALSVAFTLKAQPPFSFSTSFVFPD